MQAAEIVSINIGKPQLIKYQQRDISSGIIKRPVDQPIFLSRLNFEGDAQADLKHHGGEDKAVCVYCYEHYTYWEKELQTQLALGAFGENLTIRGLLEDDIHIGDTFQLGEAVVQVTQPRQPCYKLTARYNAPTLPLLIQQTGYTGFYFRVLKEGTVRKDDQLVRMTRHPKQISVSFANRIMHTETKNVDGIRKILEVEELSTSWRATFQKRLEGEQTDAKQRLTGQP